MNILREAAAQALEAWEHINKYGFVLADYEGPMEHAITALKAALEQPEQEKRLWLWKNFVDGKPEYWAFDNAFPTHLDCGDPQTLGEPCGYAFFKPSRQGRSDISDEEMLMRIKKAALAESANSTKPVVESEPVAWLYRDHNGQLRLNEIQPRPYFAFPVYTHPPRREWRGLTEEEIDAVWEDAQVFNTHYDIARAIEQALKEKNCD